MQGKLSLQVRTSLSAITAALAASVGLNACGGAATGDSHATAGQTTSEAGRVTGGGGTTTQGGGASGGSGAGSGAGGTSAAGAVTGGTGQGGAEVGGESSAGTSSAGAPGNQWACKNPMPVVDGQGKPTDQERCESGGNHRTQPVECTVAVPRAEACQAASGGTNECASDAECTAKPYGLCAEVGQLPTCTCNYGCKVDADCGVGQLCACGGSVGFCMAANCHSDADCQDGFQCRSFQDPQASLCNQQRFECQTPNDTCDSDASCPAGQSCVADDKGEHHCRTFPCAVPGRPFLIDGHATVACLVERRDWLAASEFAPSERLSAEARQALSEHYARAAQLEHASIAAFARFALQLLALGAPPELVAGAQRAMGDETEHTKTCFALAARYAGRALGPAALPIDGCLAGTDLSSVLRLTVREGCFGETVAAISAAEAGAHACDEGVKAALAVIAEDELRHAELAFRFVRWALEQDEACSAIVIEEVAAAERRVAAISMEARGDDDGARIAHGLLPEAHLAALEQRVVGEVVGRLLRELVVDSRRAA